MSTKAQTTKELLRPSDVSEKFGLSPMRLKRLRMRGDGPRYIKPGLGRNAMVYYTEAAVWEWLESVTRAPTREADDV